MELQELVLQLERLSNILKKMPSEEKNELLEELRENLFRAIQITTPQ